MRVATVGLALLWTGCGLLANGTTRQLPVRSAPTGAEVWVDGVYAGVTPLRLLLAPDGEHLVQVRAPGHQTRSYRIESTVAAGFVVADILFTALIGLVVDGVTDGWKVPDPGSLQVRLTRVDPGDRARAPPPPPTPPPGRHEP